MPVCGHVLAPDPSAPPGGVLQELESAQGKVCLVGLASWVGTWPVCDSLQGYQPYGAPGGFSSCSRLRRRIGDIFIVWEAFAGAAAGSRWLGCSVQQHALSCFGWWLWASLFAQAPIAL